MFSFIWSPAFTDSKDDTSMAKAIELSLKYPGDLQLKAYEIFEEIRFMNRIGQSLLQLGKTSSLRLLNRIFEKSLQILFQYQCQFLKGSNPSASLP